MKKITMILMALVLMSGCVLDVRTKQIVTDSMIESAGSYAVMDLARHIRKNHPGDVKRYIAECDKILSETNNEVIEAYINDGLNALIAEKINPVAALAVKNMFYIDVDTGKIKLDRGSLRTAISLIKTFKGALGG
jgi:hypothetical protein